MTKKKTQEEYEQEVYNLVGSDFKVISRYQGLHKPIIIEHKICGYEIPTTPANFERNKYKCPNCQGRVFAYIPRKTIDEFINEVNLLTNNEFLIFGEYKNAHTDLTFIHNIPNCQYEFQTSPDNFINSKHFCPECANKIISEKQRKTQQEFEAEINLISNGEFKVIGEYINNNTPVKLKHLICGHEWEPQPGNFLNRKRCPRCESYSRAEKIIEEYLININVNHKSQYKFKDCKNIFPLPFDNAIFNDNNNIILLIEYQGEQHYKPVKHFGGETKFKKQVRNDKIKKQFCKINNIPLLIIPYWDFFILEDILNKEIPKYLNQSQIVSNEVINQ